MNRKQFHAIIEKAHGELHAREVEAAHKTLHGGLVHPGSMTADPEVQKACADFLDRMGDKILCGHTIGDLIGGTGLVTKCGACLREKQQTAQAIPK